MCRWHVVLCALVAAAGAGLAGCGASGDVALEAAKSDRAPAAYMHRAATPGAAPMADAPLASPPAGAVPTSDFAESSGGAVEAKDSDESLASEPAHRAGSAARHSGRTEIASITERDRRPRADGAKDGAKAETMPSTSPSKSERPTQQSGQLTAGSLDDVRGYSEYLNFVNRSPLRGRLPTFNPASRVLLTVRNDAGDRIPDARIVLTRKDQQPLPGSNGGPRDTITTGSDGRAMLVSGLDIPTQAETVSVTITTSDGTSHSAECSTADAEWTIVVPKAARALPTRLDLALVVDVTGSMQDELDYLKAEIDEIAAQVKAKYPNIAQRFGLIVFRDHGDEFVTRKFDFTESLPDFQKNLNVQRAAGGGDTPEAVPEALEQALTLNWSGDGTARVLFLVGDAPPHDKDTSRAFAAVRGLRGKNVSVFPVGASGVNDEAQYLFRAAAFVTRGQYLFLTDHSGIGNPHAKPQAPRYEVERLDQLMIRMIDWKLSGEEYQANRVIAVDGTDAPASPGTPIDPQPIDPPAVPQSFVTPPVLSPSPPVAVTVAKADWNWKSMINSSAVSLLWRGCLAVAVIGLLFGAPIFRSHRATPAIAPSDVRGASPNNAADNPAGGAA